MGGRWEGGDGGDGGTVAETLRGNGAVCVFACTLCAWCARVIEGGAEGGGAVVVLVEEVARVCVCVAVCWGWLVGGVDGRKGRVRVR